MSEIKKVWNFYWIFWINEDVAKNWNWKISSFIPRSMYEWCTCVTFHTRKIISKFICVFQTNLCIIQMAQIPNIKCLTLIYCALITFWEKKTLGNFRLGMHIKEGIRILGNGTSCYEHAYIRKIAIKYGDTLHVNVNDNWKVIDVALCVL